jgi:hypothetical protein
MCAVSAPSIDEAPATGKVNRRGPPDGFFWKTPRRNPQNFCFPSMLPNLYTFSEAAVTTRRRLKNDTDKGHPARKPRSAKPLT